MHPRMACPPQPGGSPAPCHRLELLTEGSRQPPAEGNVKTTPLFSKCWRLFLGECVEKNFKHISLLIECEIDWDLDHKK